MVQYISILLERISHSNHQPHSLAYPIPSHTLTDPPLYPSQPPQPSSTPATGATKPVPHGFGLLLNLVHPRLHPPQYRRHHHPWRLGNLVPRPTIPLRRPELASPFAQTARLLGNERGWEMLGQADVCANLRIEDKEPKVKVEEWKE